MIFPLNFHRELLSISPFLWTIFPFNMASLIEELHLRYPYVDFFLFLLFFSILFVTFLFPLHFHRELLEYLSSSGRSFRNGKFNRRVLSPLFLTSIFFISFYFVLFYSDIFIESQSRGPVITTSFFTAMPRSSSVIILTFNFKINHVKSSKLSLFLTSS